MTPMRVIEETPGSWRAVFDYPPFNVVDGDVFQALEDLLVRMERSETLRVVDRGVRGSELRRPLRSDAIAFALPGI